MDDKRSSNEQKCHGKEGTKPTSPLKLDANDSYERLGKLLVYLVACVVVGYCSLVIAAVLLLLDIDAVAHKGNGWSDAEFNLMHIHSSDSYEETERSQIEERIKLRAVDYP